MLLCMHDSKPTESVPFFVVQCWVCHRKTTSFGCQRNCLTWNLSELDDK